MVKFEYEGRDLEAMSFARKYHEWILGLFRDFLGKHVLEVGAGSGSFSALLAKEPLTELVVVEPSQNMYALLEKNVAHDTRIKARNAFFVDIQTEYENHFDSIVYVNVLEHVEDDVKELAHIYASLKPGGSVCIFVPALQWLYSAHDKAIGHHRRYYKKQLTTLVREAGLEIIQARYFDIFGIIPWFILLTCGLMKGDPSAGNISFYDTYIIPISRAFESIVTPPIGKNILMVARKPI